MSFALASQSPLAQPGQLPLRPAAAILLNQGSALVVAPHPDSEILGCGGAIALLRYFGKPVRVLVISDGVRSHPQAGRFPTPAVKGLRESETLEALRTLSIAAPDVSFMQFAEGSIPHPGIRGFWDAVTQCQQHLTALRPELIFLPWRHDPHPDHQATWQIMHKAIERLPYTPRQIEYPIWEWDAAQRQTRPHPTRHTLDQQIDQIDQIDAWRLDISSVSALKQRAIAAYRSQTPHLLNSEHESCHLTPELLANFTHPWEVYLEVTTVASA